MAYRKLDGLRIAPSIYTSIKDLDKLVDAIKELAALPPPEKK
jgi:selenocysteine lyase/cysteine desulfurase